MLYNPRWNKRPTKRASLEDVAAWLETKDPDETYCYYRAAHCMAAQYNKDIGRTYQYDRNFFMFVLHSMKKFNRQLEDIASKGEWTFGAALQRTRDMLAA